MLTLTKLVFICKSKKFPYHFQPLLTTLLHLLKTFYLKCFLVAFEDVMGLVFYNLVSLLSGAFDLFYAPFENSFCH